MDIKPSYIRRTLGERQAMVVDMENKWCMCTELNGVARDGDSTCSICGGKDAYGGSPERPKDKKKVLVGGKNTTSSNKE